MVIRMHETKLITQERRRISFNLKELTNLLDGGKEKTALRYKIENVILNDPKMKSDDISCISWKQQHIHGLKRMNYFYTYLSKIMDWDYTSTRAPELEFLTRTVGLATALMLHPCAFIPSVVSLGTKEQIEKWYPLSKNNYILGCYAQTELGHGTNLHGLETTAVYDPSDQNFVINCPTITSIKWWPGELGTCANHALVMAQLCTQGTNYGMHGFIVQIRDLDSHAPIPGITIGSIGPTMAIGGTDNGFLKLNNVKIPRQNMLAKYAEVHGDGTYVKKGNKKLMYASMVNLRVLMTRDEAVLLLQKACTIAARYSCVRKQGSLNAGGPEIQIIDFVTQQHKIIPQVASAYAFHFTIKQVLAMYFNFLKNLDEGNLTNLSELHCVTAGVKAYLTEQCAEGVEIVRRACGGHGFSQSSGLPMLLARVTASCTYEGENTVMYLQCARFLLKCAAKLFMNQPLSGTVKYLTDPIVPKCKATRKEDFFDLGLLTDCFKHRVQFMLKDIAMSMQNMVAEGASEMDAWNLSSIGLVDLAKAHMSQYVLSCFIEFIGNAVCSQPTKSVLSKLCALYGIHQLNANSRDFLKDGFISGNQCKLSQEAEVELLMALRNDVVGLVDAFEFRDETLSSCIGAFDGDVYKRLFDHAKNLPINQKPVDEEIYEHIRPNLLIGRDQLKKLSKL